MFPGGRGGKAAAAKPARKRIKYEEAESSDGEDSDDEVCGVGVGGCGRVYLHCKSKRRINGTDELWV